MKKFLFLLTSSIFLACNNSPQAIRYGFEECTACKMTIMDEKFGAEIISTKGKVYKFDDIICMVRFLSSGNIDEKGIREKLVIDYEHKNSFLTATEATYFVSDEIHSPMNGQAGSFAGKQEALNFQHGKQGIIMDWNEVYHKLK